MKNKLAFILVLFISFLSCSKNDDDNDTELTITRCFTVRELGTEIPIPNAIMSLNSSETGCGGAGGCAPIPISGTKSTDLNGEVCFELTTSQNEDIAQIICFKAQYLIFVLNNPSIEFQDIFLEPL